MKPGWYSCAVVFAFLAHFIVMGAETDTLAVRTTDAILSLVPGRPAGMLSITESPDGKPVLDPDSDAPLFVLSLSKAGDRGAPLTWISSGDGKVEEAGVNGTELRIVFAGFDREGLRVTCRITGDGDRFVWGIEVAGSPDDVLETVRYPIIDLDDTLAESSFVAGLTKGGFFRNPGQWKKGQSLVADQPGRLCAQFAGWLTETRGLFTATHDADGYPKTLRLTREAELLRLSWDRRMYHALASPFVLEYPIVTSLLHGTPEDPLDWRHAADAYKSWALRQPWCQTRFFDRPDIPDWLKSGPAMIRFSRHWLGQGERVEAWLKDYWRPNFGEVPLVVALWGWEHISSWISPAYFPLYPSEEGFADIVREIRAVNGHPFPWPSGYYWNVEFGQREDGSFEWTDWERFDAEARPHALVGRDGQALIRKLPWLNGGRNAALCRGDAWTRQWFTDNSLQLLKRGCDMIQIDQVVGGAAPGGGNCFADNHGHPLGPGRWDMDAFRQQLIQLAEQGRAMDPGLVLSIEEPQEFCNSYIGIQDYRDVQVLWKPEKPGHMPASVFGYLYHEFLPVFQSNPRAGDRQALAYCVATGQIPHWVPHWPVRPSPLLDNGDMEAWGERDPAGWGKVSGWRGKAYAGSAVRDETIFHGGSSSLRLENEGEKDIVQVSRNLQIGPGALVPGQTVRFSAWIKVDKVAEESHIMAAALTHSLESKGGCSLPYGEPGDWRWVSATFTVPADAAFLRIMIHATGPCRLWVDDLALEVENEDGWHTLENSGKPVEDALLRRWVELFHGEGCPYLLHGVMLHPPRLLSLDGEPVTDASEQDIFLNAFRARDLSEAAVVVNAAFTGRRLTLRWRGEDTSCEIPPMGIELIRRPPIGRDK